MKQFSALAVLVIAVFSSGERAQADVLLAVGSNLNYELDTAGREYQAKQALAIRGGWRFKPVDVYGEFSYRKDRPEGSEMIQVGTENHEFLIWLRKSYPGPKVFKPYVAAAAGIHRTSVTTVLADEVSEDEGQLEGTVAAAAGLEILFSQHFHLTFEGRVSSASTYSPNPLLGGAAYIGVLF